MPTLYLQPQTIITPDGPIQNGAVLISDGIITQVAPSSALQPPPGAAILPADGLILAPGYIDLQLNGAFGYDFTDDPSSIWHVASLLPRYGVTSFLPTIITAPPETTAHAQAVLAQGPPPNFRGATPLGLHLEGPFLNPAKRGAHNPAHLRLPDLDLTRDWSPQNHVRLVTLAPELPGALDLITALTERGIIVSAGHSMATYVQASAAFAAGIEYGTHLFNAQSPLDHREPGLSLALLDHYAITTGIIADGIHVHPALIRLAYTLKGPHRFNLVSDAMSALGMPPGRYMLGDNEVISDGIAARRPEGQLAGSLLSMDQAVRNLQAYTNCPQQDAIATATTTPAKLLNLPPAIIAPNQPANMILLTPALQIHTTILNGQPIVGSQ